MVGHQRSGEGVGIREECDFGIGTPGKGIPGGKQHRQRPGRGSLQGFRDEP